MTKPRPEQEIFDDLVSLTATPGFAHVIAYLCARDNFTWFSDEMQAEDLQHLYSRTRLIRTEMFTLIGQMARANPDYDAPPPGNADDLATQAEALLEELHRSMMTPWSAVFADALESVEPPDPWSSANAMREPIFYGGEAAFSVQNCDFAAEKYAADENWLVEHKGASIVDMIAVAKAIGNVQAVGVADVVNAGHASVGDPRFLTAFTFCATNLAPQLDMPPDRITASIRAFTLPRGHRNSTFKSLHDFNAITATPIIEVDDERFILFHFMRWPTLSTKGRSTGSAPIRTTRRRRSSIAVNIPKPSRSAG